MCKKKKSGMKKGRAGSDEGEGRRKGKEEKWMMDKEGCGGMGYACAMVFVNN
jgi:hypothetical protein